MIVTVPNSGTRSLRKYLGNTSWFHFGRHEDQYRLRAEMISTTVRDPLRTLISWIDRHGGAHDIFRCLNLQIVTCADWPYGVDYHQTDGLPVHEARGEESRLKRLYDDHDMAGLLRHGSEFAMMRDWMDCENIRSFYDKRCGELWWT